MRLSRVFVEAELVEGNNLILTGPTCHYLHNVLRLKASTELRLFNTEGHEHRVAIQGISKSSVSLAIYEAIDNNTGPAFPIELGIGLSRGERFDYVVQKATELGVSRIQPLFTERTEVKLNAERAEKRLRHWEKICISACEQSGRNRLPKLAAPCDLKTWLPKVSADRRWVLDPEADNPATGDTSIESLAMLIGPEGGLSDLEIELAKTHEFEGVCLGPRVLRTETAPVVALSIAQYIWGDLS